jgi:hypothetical protein
MKPDKIIRVAKSRGLDGIAITDHNTIEGAIETARYAQQKDFLVIIGEEILTKAGEIIGLFLKENISAEDPFEVVSRIHSQGGIAVLAHPFVSHLTIEKGLAELLDACEGFNARHARVKTLVEVGGERLIADFAKEHGLSLVAGSDAHFYREIGRARTIIPASNLSEVKEAILRGTTALTGKKTPPVYLVLTALIREFRRLLNPLPEYDT